VESRTWLAALEVVTARCGADPGTLAAMGREGFTALIRGAVAGWGITRAHGPICARVFAALTDTEGAVTWSRRGLLRRVADELGDLKRTRAQLRRAEADMVAGRLVLLHPHRPVARMLGLLGVDEMVTIVGETPDGSAADGSAG
jgi:hypothetical protein